MARHPGIRGRGRKGRPSIDEEIVAGVRCATCRRIHDRGPFGRCRFCGIARGTLRFELEDPHRKAAGSIVACETCWRRLISTSKAITVLYA